MSTHSIDDLLFRCIVYHLPPGLYHSVRRNPSLNCLHRHRSLASVGHAKRRWWVRMSLHLVLCLPSRLVHSRGVHAVTLIVHLLSLNRAGLHCKNWFVVDIVNDCHRGAHDCAHDHVAISSVRDLVTVTVSPSCHHEHVIMTCHCNHAIVSL